MDFAPLVLRAAELGSLADACQEPVLRGGGRFRLSHLRLSRSLSASPQRHVELHVAAVLPHLGELPQSRQSPFYSFTRGVLGQMVGFAGTQLGGCTPAIPGMDATPRFGLSESARKVSRKGIARVCWLSRSCTPTSAAPLCTAAIQRSDRGCSTKCTNLVQLRLRNNH